jgi:hypothetical protein
MNEPKPGVARYRLLLGGLLLLAVAAAACDTSSVAPTPTPVAVASSTPAPSASPATPTPPPPPSATPQPATAATAAPSATGAALATPAGASTAASPTTDAAAPAAPATAPAAAPPASPAATPPPPKPVFVIYYLWWTHQHWLDRLGSQYPLAASPNPLPATLDATGCGATTPYAGNVLTDISQGLAYDQDNPATILNDVRLAASLGVTGFAVNWKGDGTTTQSPTSVAFNRRLQWVFDAAHQVTAEGTPFKIQLNYQGSANILPLPVIINDLAYFTARYAADPALDHTYSPKVELIWAGSWKYSDADLATVSQAARPGMYILGDEKPGTWNPARAAPLDGATYYWSSQDPYSNAASFGQLRQFGAAIHALTNPDGRPKTWLAPFTPGYNATLLYKTTTCVPRNGGATMRALYNGNRASNPDGWTLISWNEISEGSYIVPLTRYGPLFTDTLKAIIAAP